MAGYMDGYKEGHEDGAAQGGGGSGSGPKVLTKGAAGHDARLDAEQDKTEWPE